MKKNIGLYMTLLIVMIFTVGCRSKNTSVIQDNNDDWSVRYIGVTDTLSEGNVTAVRVDLSVNVYKDMSETDFLDILDYYEDTYNSSYDSNNTFLGERDGDYTCYAVFYKGDTDELITKIKYQNREKVSATDEDEAYFPKPELRSSSLSDN